jgi:hypothetical protein
MTGYVLSRQTGPDAHSHLLANLDYRLNEEHGASKGRIRASDRRTSSGWNFYSFSAVWT